MRVYPIADSHEDVICWTPILVLCLSRPFVEETKRPAAREDHDVMAAVTAVKFGRIVQ
jgi:hypothetical protein